MKQLYKFSLLLFLLPAMLIARPGDGKYKKSKKLSKTFTVNKTCLVEIDNEFGSVTITTWDQPTVAIDVNVEVSGNNEDRVKSQLADIEVDFEASASRIKARTDAEHSGNSNNSLWSSLFNNDSNRSSNMKIDYIIKMPVTGSVDISNDYGAVILDKLEGHAKIKCDFGRLDIGQLLAENNYLQFDYTKNSHIDYMKSGTIRADFSGLDLYGCEKVEYRGDYTKVRFHDTKDINFNGDFSTIISDKAFQIIGRGDYSTIKLGTITGNVNLRTEFGSVNINELGKDFTNATLRSEYTGIKVGYHPDAEFRFDIDTEFASIKLSDDCTVTRSEKDSTDKLKSGYTGSENSKAVVNIRSSFGGVNLQRN